MINMIGDDTEDEVLGVLSEEIEFAKNNPESYATLTVPVAAELAQLLEDLATGVEIDPDNHPTAAAMGVDARKWAAALRGERKTGD